MRINVLGPLQVVSSAGEAAAGPPKQRALLCLLVMHADRILDPGSIIDHLWGNQPPASAAANLHVYVSQVRRLLEPDRGRDEPPLILVTEGGGYGLRSGTLLTASMFPMLALSTIATDLWIGAVAVRWVRQPTDITTQ